jgi:hypothetical protein
MVSEGEPPPVLKLVAETVAVQFRLPLLVTLTCPSCTVPVCPVFTVPIVPAVGTVTTGGAITARGIAKTGATVMVRAPAAGPGGSTKQLAHSTPPVPIRKEKRGHERDRDPTHAPFCPPSHVALHILSDQMMFLCVLGTRAAPIHLVGDGRVLRNSRR